MPLGVAGSSTSGDGSGAASSRARRTRRRAPPTSPRRGSACTRSSPATTSSCAPSTRSEQLLERHRRRLRALAAHRAQPLCPAASPRGADVAQAETQLETTRAQAIDLGVRRAQLEHAIAVLVGEPPATFAIAGAPLDDAAARAAGRRAVGAARAPARHRRGRASRRGRQRADRRRRGGVLPDRHPERVRAASRRRSSPTGSPGRAASGRSGRRSPRPSSTAACARAQTDAGARRLRRDRRHLPPERADRLPGGRGQPRRAAHPRAGGGACRTRPCAPRATRCRSPRNKYKAGIASYLDVVTTQAIALGNERTAVDVLGRRMASSVQLVTALGGGWGAGELPSPGDLARTAP